MFGPWLFLRLLAVAYLTAFGSLYFQIEGLIGENGIAPYPPFFEYLRADSPGLAAYWRAPSLLWLLPVGPLTLKAVTLTGAVLSLGLLFGRFERWCLLLLWLSYLSLVSADYLFLQFQWDHLLLEAGALAFFLPLRTEQGWSSVPLARLLLQFLLFRLMFGSGLVKLLSGDPEWRSLSALRFHYLTQPLPSLPAYYLHKLPSSFQSVCAGGMFVIELLLPFFFFGPRPLRHFAASATIALQLAIFCSGNYAFFNLLTIGLAVVLYDDRFFSDRLPRLGQAIRCRLASQPNLDTPRWAFGPLCVLLVLASLQLFELAGGALAPPSLARISRNMAPLRLVNSYGLFAVMTTKRDEIEIETSADLKSWTPLRYRFKPQALGMPPTQIAPYQPRLDWQLWFAALGTVKENRWFVHLLELLLKRSPEVLSLFRTTPGSDEPRFIRALLYRYRFSTMSERAIDGMWWKRELVGLYCPPLQLAPNGGVAIASAQQPLP